jgi:hypothetical protein
VEKAQRQRPKIVLITQLQSERKLLRKKPHVRPQVVQLLRAQRAHAQQLLLAQRLHVHHAVIVHAVKSWLVVTLFLKRYAKQFRQQSY